MLQDLLRLQCMLGEMQLKKHQVRDPREVSRLIRQFVDPVVKLGLLLLCVLPFHISGKIILYNLA